MVKKMSKMSNKSAASASAKALAKAKAARRAAEVEMVQAIGNQINNALSILCSAVVESRRIDMEGLESGDKAQVLQSEGTTLVALVESNNEALASMWDSVAPMASMFLGQMAEVQATEAEAQLKRAEAELLNAETRAAEIEIKKTNSQTEALKAETAREAARSPP